MDEDGKEVYREVTFRASCYFTNSSAPAQSNQYYAGCSPEIFDYYTGEWLPISNTLGDASEDENTCSYALNIDGEEVRLDYMMSVYWEKDVGDCARIAITLTQCGCRQTTTDSYSVRRQARITLKSFRRSSMKEKDM